MAGSLKYLIYQDDAAQEWFHLGDESNIESILVDPTIADFELTDEGNVVYGLPSNVTPRRALFESTTTDSTRTMIVPTLAIYQALRTKDTAVALTVFSDASGETFRLRRLSPEEILIPRAVDTGLDDGDVT